MQGPEPDSEVQKEGSDEGELGIGGLVEKEKKAKVEKVEVVVEKVELVVEEEEEVVEIGNDVTICQYDI